MVAWAVHFQVQRAASQPVHVLAFPHPAAADAAVHAVWQGDCQLRSLQV